MAAFDADGAGRTLAEGVCLIFRTPEVVEFAVSPQVGQAVLAFARSYSSSGPNSARAGRRQCLPHLRSSGHRKELLSPFPPPGRNCRARSGGLTFTAMATEAGRADLPAGGRSFEVM